jgi:hypothetical protein
MAKIAEIVSLNPWWKHEAEFDRYGRRFGVSSPGRWKMKNCKVK